MVQYLIPNKIDSPSHSAIPHEVLGHATIRIIPTFGHKRGRHIRVIRRPTPIILLTLSLFWRHVILVPRTLANELPPPVSKSE